MTNNHFTVSHDLVALRDSFTPTRAGYEEVIATLNTITELRGQMGVQDTDGTGLFAVIMMRSAVSELAALGKDAPPTHNVLNNLLTRWMDAAHALAYNSEDPNVMPSATWDGSVLTLKTRYEKLMTDADVAKMLEVDEEDVRNLKFDPSQRVSEALMELKALKGKKVSVTNPAAEIPKNGGTKMVTKDEVDTILKTFAKKAAEHKAPGGGGIGTLPEDQKKSA